MFRQRGRFCLPNDVLTRFNQEEPFDLSQKPAGLPGHHLSQSDGESVPGSSCQEEDEESLYRRSPYSPEVDHHEHEEPDEASAAQWGGGDLKQTGQDGRTLDGESAVDEETARDKGHLLQPQETPPESESEAGDQVCRHETSRRQSNGRERDSEDEDHHLEANEHQPRPGGYCEEEEKCGLHGQQSSMQ